MRRLQFCALALASIVGGEILKVRATAQASASDAQKRDENQQFVEKYRKTFYEPLRIEESKPVTMNDARFVAVAQTQWQPGRPHPAVPIVAPIDIQLRITNLSKRDILFPTFQTFGIRVLKADGKEVKSRGGRDGTTVTGPLALPGGASYALCRRAELRWDEKTQAPELVYYDGTGSESIIGPLAPGPYKLVFWYAAAPDRLAKPKSGATAIWVGEVVTNEVRIQVLNGKIGGFAPHPGSFPEASKEVQRIGESKAVTMNNAQLVVVARTDWKPGKVGQGVPIDLQLRLTNLSKEDVIFHTFDTFVLSIRDKDGKQIMPAGGRNLTIFTRPIVIPRGGSYSICRKAELRWNAGTGTSELVFWNGTGMEVSYGSLRPGRYTLTFWYGVSADPPLKELLRPERKMGDPPTWLGTVATEPVFIEILDR